MTQSVSQGSASGRPTPYWHWGAVGIRWTLCLAGVTLVTLGCSSRHELETAPVSGRVTLDGQPVTSGYVFVIPSEGRMGKAEIQPDGTFVLGTYDEADGAQVGTHPAIVTPIPPDEGGARPGATKIPQKYVTAQTSGLSINVEAGKKNTVELTLSSGPN